MSATPRNRVRPYFLIASCVGLLLAAIGCVPRRGAPAAPTTNWVAAWEAPPQLTEQRNLPPTPGIAGSTLRQTLRASIPGTRWRIRVSNEFGDGPLTFSSVHVARGLAGRDTVDTATDARATFGGRDTVTIPAGGAAVSDVVALAAPSLADLVVSMYIISAPAGVTGHPGSRTTSYLLQGNRADARTLPGASKTEHWYLLSRIDVVAPPNAAAVVILGNSIADGRGSGTDKNDRWPDNLARRLRAGAATKDVSVLNAGIGGNAVVTGGLGPAALQRLDRDVLDQPGVRWLIVSEGVNDLGASRSGLADSVATKLIGAYREIVMRAHARHLRVYGATMLPFGASFYATPDREAARQRINAWIRTTGNFDDVIDFDAVMRDSADPTRLRSDADSGDHLHPNQNGYRIMAEAIELTLFAEKYEK